MIHFDHKANGRRNGRALQKPTKTESATKEKRVAGGVRVYTCKPKGASTSGDLGVIWGTKRSDPPKGF